MTARLTDEQFGRLTSLRVSQGFSAAQVVIGIPPETTPDDPNAASPVGPAWTWSGEFNQHYLEFSRKRIQYMNQTGLSAIIYGAWGHHINWIGTSRMIDWWQSLIKSTHNLDVVYCLTGESAHNLGFFDSFASKVKSPMVFKFGEKARRSKSLRRLFHNVYQNSNAKKNRRRHWSEVLEQVAGVTDKPVFIHPSPPDTGFVCVENPHLLAINTVQTGHSYSTRSAIYRLPLAHAETRDLMGRGFVNLEPWYEGIMGQFHASDQLYAYWASMLAGASGYCYGAQGIWNAGDGKFLNHWGEQTFEQALELDTPRLIGLSHQLLRPYLWESAETTVLEQNSELICIRRDYPQVSFSYFPEVSKAEGLPTGKVWLPMAGGFTDQVPARGQVVICSSKS